MAGKKVKSEVEGIRNELQSLSEAVWALREHINIQNAVAEATTSSKAARSSSAGRDLAADLAGSTDGRGVATTQGVVRNATGDREYRWEHASSTEDLLGIEDETAARVLAAIGHRQRLAIVKAIIDKPTSAADLVTSLDLGTTGAAYHHLNVLQAADLVTQETRGVFAIQPHRVSAIFSIFAGIASAIDTTVVEPSSANGSAPEDPVRGGKRKKRKST